MYQFYVTNIQCAGIGEDCAEKKGLSFRIPVKSLPLPLDFSPLRIVGLALTLSSRGSSTRGWGKRGEELEGERIRSLPAPTTFPFGNDITSVIDRWRKVDGIPICFFFDEGSVEL